MFASLLHLPVRRSLSAFAGRPLTFGGFRAALDFCVWPLALVDERPGPAGRRVARFRGPGNAGGGTGPAGGVPPILARCLAGFRRGQRAPCFPQLVLGFSTECARLTVLLETPLCCEPPRRTWRGHNRGVPPFKKKGGGSYLRRSCALSSTSYFGGGGRGLYTGAPTLSCVGWFFG